jgi:NAD(P)-dependent dehydrogenase (short-subunit alcohol dehydrogenase family)
VDLELQGKTILITGAGGSIGRDIARGFAEEGANLFLTDADSRSLEDAGSAASDMGASVSTRVGNVTNSEAVSTIVSEALEWSEGQIAVLVNLAGVVAQNRIEDIPEDEWDRMFAVSCKGTYLFCKNVVPSMKRAGYGRIINMASQSGRVGSPLMSHYSAAKAAIIGFSQALALELAGDGITVNALCPGITEKTGVWEQVSAGYVAHLDMDRERVEKEFSSRVPLKRFATVRDITAVALFLASEQAGYLTGQAADISGGRIMK